MDENHLRDLATRFRATLEGLDRAALPLQFQSFPRGSCGDTTELLGTFLTENGLGPFSYVLGWHGESLDRTSHAWLERDGWIVDVTADQFGGMSPVIVTRNSPFHVSLRGEALHVADYRLAGDVAAAELGGVYRQITEHLERAI